MDTNYNAPINAPIVERLTASVCDAIMAAYGRELTPNELAVVSAVRENIKQTLNIVYANGLTTGVAIAHLAQSQAPMLPTTPAPDASRE